MQGKFDAIALGCTRAVAEKMLGSILNHISTAVTQGDRVTLVGFGSFDASVRKPRTGRNPRAGADIDIPGRKVPKFSPGKDFKDQVNEGVSLSGQESGGISDHLCSGDRDYIEGFTTPRSK